MNIWFVIIVIAFLSVVLSLVSLKNLDNKPHVNLTKKNLKKGRVIFQDTSSSSKE